MLGRFLLYKTDKQNKARVGVPHAITASRLCLHHPQRPSVEFQGFGEQNWKTSAPWPLPCLAELPEERWTYSHSPNVGLRAVPKPQIIMTNT